MSLFVVSALFFFSSRRRHTRFSRDWSSDVCSSDLFVGWLLLTVPIFFAARYGVAKYRATIGERVRQSKAYKALTASQVYNIYKMFRPRSEERRVGKEGVSRWAAEFQRSNR